MFFDEFVKYGFMYLPQDIRKLCIVHSKYTALISKGVAFLVVPLPFDIRAVYLVHFGHIHQDRCTPDKPLSIKRQYTNKTGQDDYRNVLEHDRII